MNSAYFLLLVIRILFVLVLCFYSGIKSYRQRQVGFLFPGLCCFLAGEVIHICTRPMSMPSLALMTDLAYLFGLICCVMAFGSFRRALKHELPGHVARFTREAAREHKQQMREISKQNMKMRRELLNRIQVETELEEAKEAAEQAVESKSEFLANITHELRTPMHGILSYANFGVQKFDKVPPEKILFYFKQIDTSGKRLMQMINNLLDLSRMEAGRLSFNFSRNDLNDLLREVIRELRILAQRRHIVIKMKQTEPDFFCVCDAPKIAQVFTNLISNAIKYSLEDSEVSVWFENLEWQPPGKDARISAVKFVVKDRGIGIPVDEVQSVFDKFVQSSKTKTGAGGSGVGLSICKEIVKAHNGEIWTENNTDGEGSKFCFIIPLEPLVDKTPERSASS